MSDPAERHVLVSGRRCRVWEKGVGEPLGFLGGLRGLPRWPHFLDLLAERRRVIAPSLPGQFGAAEFDELDDLPDWVSTQPGSTARISSARRSAPRSPPRWRPSRAPACGAWC
jgi:hypothetical protein